MIGPRGPGRCGGLEKPRISLAQEKKSHLKSSILKGLPRHDIDPTIPETDYVFEPDRVKASGCFTGPRQADGFLRPECWDEKKQCTWNPVPKAFRRR